MSRGVGPKEEPGKTREQAEVDEHGREFAAQFKQLWERGIPIVLSSGNFGEQAKRDVIDMIPQVMEKDDFPVINVGAATLEGRPWSRTQGQGSQDGTQLTIYGVGVDVAVHTSKDGEAVIRSGTSLAAPVIAGIIAVHMNYLPWQKELSGIERVKEIKRWIQTSESSWERNKSPKPDKPDLKVNMVSAEPIIPQQDIVDKRP
jgi:hypothetical protein